jgi:hypothetical protein
LDPKIRKCAEMMQFECLTERAKNKGRQFGGGNKWTSPMKNASKPARSVWKPVISVTVPV